MTNKREFFKHFIGVDLNEEKEMLQTLGLKDLSDLFSHLPKEILHDGMKIENGLSLENLKENILTIAKKNHLKTNFIGDGLHSYKLTKSVPRVAGIRGLSTAYTPYQPERSQGTLQTLWIYQNLISKITGFEAINASLYERSTCLYEALTCSTRIKKNLNKVLVCEAIYPGDIEVLQTQSIETSLIVDFTPIDKKTGRTDLEKLEEKLATGEYASLAIPQINNLGLVEEFNKMTDLCHKYNVLVIAMVDLFSLANTGLKEPAAWGDKGVGADILVAEGQPMTIGPNYGGPGLGIFGIRYNENEKLMIRSSAGRFIGKTTDINGRPCKSIILSTREQHIRREKATSNICSNQSFVASLCGASLLERGSAGLDKTFKIIHENSLKLAQELTLFEGVDLLYSGCFYNEFVLKLNTDVAELINQAAEEDLHIGVNLTNRFGLKEQLLKVTVTDIVDGHGLQKFINFFKKKFASKSISNQINSISQEFKRKIPFNIIQLDDDVIYNYYAKLGNQNLSPDDGIYPLGSCTMKYNPEINEWAAGLDEFTLTHPQARLEDVQGNLELLYNIQEIFKDITGLPGLTTQPLAGAQGELVGLKMFQAYHRDRGEEKTRNIILIPKSAHGTNPATATMAGYETKKVDGKLTGIITINANSAGEIDFEELKTLVETYQSNIAGIMITNPNTAGIFETKFKEIADLIHSVGGLVYMDGANMNAIAGHIDLNKLGVDAVHNNLHKTWSIPHGGGGPGDAIVAVSEKLMDYLPGKQVYLEDGVYTFKATKKSIGSFHRHAGNFAHKVRAYTYLKALGADGIRRMSAIAVLNARYLYHKLKDIYPVLPEGSENTPRMHEFILTLSDENFARIASAKTPKPNAIARVGKLFLDFGFHAPTVAFPEVYGLMIEPTESFSKSELDGFCKVVENIHHMINEYPQILQTVPHFTPIDRVDELSANKTPQFTNKIDEDILSPILDDRISAAELRNMESSELIKCILKAHEKRVEA